MVYKQAHVYPFLIDRYVFQVYVSIALLSRSNACVAYYTNNVFTSFHIILSLASFDDGGEDPMTMKMIVVYAYSTCWVSFCNEIVSWILSRTGH